MHGLEEEAIERLANWAQQFVPALADDGIEEWIPYPPTEDQEGYEPVEPFYTEKSLREKAERKAARQPRKYRTE